MTTLKLHTKYFSQSINLHSKVTTELIEKLNNQKQNVISKTFEQKVGRKINDSDLNGAFPKIRKECNHDGSEIIRYNDGSYEGLVIVTFYKPIITEIEDTKHSFVQQINILYK